MLFVLVCVICCLVFALRCLLLFVDARCLLLAVCCLLFVVVDCVVLGCVHCLLFIVCCVLFVCSCKVCVVRCELFLV